MDQRPPEGEHSKNGLPVISQETRDRILEEIGVDVNSLSQPTPPSHPTDQLIREMVDLSSGKTHRGMTERSKRAEKVTLSSLGDIADSKPELLKVLQEAVAEGLESNDPIFITEYARGIGLVIKAFHIQSDFRLIPDLEKLRDEDLSRIGEVVSSGIKLAGGLDVMSDPFTKALNAPRIPASQQFLREVIDAPTKVNEYMFSADYRAGAGVMYKAMEVIWSRLYPGQTPPGESPGAPPAPPQQGPQSPGSL